MTATGEQWTKPATPIQRVDGYLPIEDHGLIGDGSTAALVGRDGAISWLCAPRFDSPALFCSILDRNKGGHFLVAPEGLIESRQRYVPIAACSLRSCADRPEPSS